MDLVQLYRKDLEKNQILRDFIDRDRCVTVSIVEVPAETLSKFLDMIDAADALAFQYKGVLQWMTDTDSECDDHQKLVDVYKAYRKARTELEPT